MAKNIKNLEQIKSLHVAAAEIIGQAKEYQWKINNIEERLDLEPVDRQVLLMTKRNYNRTMHSYVKCMKQIKNLTKNL